LIEEIAARDTYPVFYPVAYPFYTPIHYDSDRGIFIGLTGYATRRQKFRLLPINLTGLQTMEINTLINTEDFAAERLVKPNTIRSAYCRNGHYQNIVPIKMPNGRLGWPCDSLKQSNEEAQK